MSRAKKKVKVPLRFKRCVECRRGLATMLFNGAAIESVLALLSTLPSICPRHLSSKRLHKNEVERLLLREEIKTTKTKAKSTSGSDGAICEESREQQEEEEEEARLQLQPQGDDDDDDDGSVMPPWGSLPPDLIDRILCYLPLPALARLQLVCKHWRAKVSSTDSTLLHLDAPSRNPWLVVNKHSPDFHGLSAFDPCAKRWFRIPFSFEGIPWEGSMCAASGGLFCLLNRSGKHPAAGLVVCNPLTRQWRMLPALPASNGYGAGAVVAMTTDPSTAAYKVVVITVVGERWHHGHPFRCYLPLVYDSASGSGAWQTKSIGLARFTCYDTWRSVLSNGTTLYALSSSVTFLLSYNLEADSWTEETFVKDPTRQLDGGDSDVNIPRLPFIVECQGRLFLVARLKRGGSLGTLKQRCSLGRLPLTLHNIVGLWELRTHPHRWELVTYTPLAWMEDVVVASEGTDFLVASDGDSRIWLVLAGSHSMLTYDLNSGKWSLQKPGCPGEDCLDAYLRKAVFAPLMWTASV